MRSTARLSATAQVVPDIEEQIARLQAYEDRGVPTKIDFKAAAGAELWEKHWAHHKKLLEFMRVADEDAREIRVRVRAAYAEQRAALDWRSRPNRSRLGPECANNLRACQRGD